MRLLEADEEKKNVMEEHRVMKQIFNEVYSLSDSRMEQIVELRQQLVASKKEHAEANVLWQEKYDMETDAIETTFSNELEQCKKIFSCEVEVQ